MNSVDPVNHGAKGSLYRGNEELYGAGNNSIALGKSDSQTNGNTDTHANISKDNSSKELSSDKNQSSSPPVQKTKKVKDIGQGKIDQALELCNYAQEMWEEGDLNEALNSLDSAYYLILEIDDNSSQDIGQQKEDVRYLISKRILEIYASRQIVVTGQHDEIPITMNKYVQAEIKRLTGPDKRFFIQSLERAARYRPYIVEELKKAGLPEELSWLPLIESGFKLRALSSARALGLWQFMASTGHKFGLNRNHYIDERMDPEKSTKAAIAYLKELHNLFGDWTTALASYNCGEYRVLRTIRRQKINYLDNFWDLYNKLPRETVQYIPRFLATVYIVKHLDKYNMEIKNPLAPIEYETFAVKKQVRLKDIAKAINVDPKLLTQLNPELRYDLLPPETYQLKIPKDKASIFLSKLDTIKSTYSPPPMYVYHRVRKGDTLSGLAKKYSSSIRTISRANNISRSHTIVVGKVLKIPSRQYDGSASIAKTDHKVKFNSKKPIRYKVNRGDNLWIIAKRFSTTTKQLMALNKLPNTSLHIGQTLYITPNNRTISKKRTTIYRVKSGDSPFLIAKRYKMDLNRFLSLNHLKKWSKIFPGQKIIIE
ncbi:MAG: LysM peptidoglycan-binding domain-containing protein [Desulfobacteraceae bacterium]|nr:LysM peptidoglycan-binding domain-containing protein [Desulfobacteraceae bacterium]